MKKFLLIILSLTTVLSTLIACNKGESFDNNLNTSAAGTTKSNIYTPEDDYPNKYDGYMMSVGDSYIQTGYIPKSVYNGEIPFPSDTEKPTFKLGDVEYILICRSTGIAAYEDYIVDVYFAYNPEIDDVNIINQKSYILHYRRDNGKLVGMMNAAVRTHSEDKCYLGELPEEDVEYAKDELVDFAKEMAKEYVGKFGLDMNVDECELVYKETGEKWGDFYYFHKCLDGVPTYEYVRVDVSSDGKCWGVQTSGIGMYDKFANAKIDIDAIKKIVSNPKKITLLNDEGTLVAEVDYEVYVEYTPEEQDLGYPEAGYVTRTKYIPLVPKEIEKE